MKLRTLPALLLTLLSAGMALAQASVDSEKTRPDLVSIGMTIAQVEELMGVSPEDCWDYDEGKYERDSICFRDGVAGTGDVGKRTPRWRQPRFLLDGVEFYEATGKYAVDVSEKDVEQSWGPPDIIRRSYWHGGDDWGIWIARYRQGRLIEFTVFRPKLH